MEAKPAGDTASTVGAVLEMDHYQERPVAKLEIYIIGVIGVSFAILRILKR
jgi:hypothetical protein